MKVKENRTVFIALCAISQEKITMPQLTDISYQAGGQYYRKFGFDCRER